MVEDICVGSEVSTHSMRVGSSQILKLRYTREEAAEALGLSLRTLDYRIETQDLATKRDGRRVFITASELRRYANRDHTRRVQ
jgi:hypothetical protein